MLMQMRARRRREEEQRSARWWREVWPTLSTQEQNRLQRKWATGLLWAIGLFVAYIVAIVVLAAHTAKDGTPP